MKLVTVKSSEKTENNDLILFPTAAKRKDKTTTTKKIVFPVNDDDFGKYEFLIIGYTNVDGQTYTKKGFVMANTFEKVLNVIGKKPSLRQDFEIQGLLPWLRKKSKIFATLKTGK